MAKRKLKRSLEISEAPSDVALKCLIQTFIAIVILIPVMSAMAQPLFAFEVVIGTLFFTSILLLYTYSKIFRFVIYGVSIFVFFAFLLFLFSNRGSSPTLLLYELSTSRIPSVIVVFGINCFLYGFIVVYASFIMCFLFLGGIITGVIVAGYGFPLGNFTLVLVALYIVYMLERNSTLYVQASEINRQMIITPPKMTFNMFLSYILIYVLLTTASIPAGPLLGSYSNRIIDNITLKIEGLFGKPTEVIEDLGEMFDISSMGFGNSGELGGDVTMNNTKMLTVYSDYSGIYLGGAVYENYSGRRWSSYESYSTIDLNNKATNLRQVETERYLGVNTNFNISEQRENYKTINVVVRHERTLRTKSLFTLSKTYGIDFSRGVLDGYFNSSVWQKEVNSVNIDTHEKFRYKYAIPENGAYALEAYTLNLNSEHLYKMMTKAEIGYYRTPWVTSLKYIDWDNIITGDISSELSELSIRSTTFYKKYLQLPSSIPDRVYNLAYELTKDYKHTYEKAKAIEQYLKNNHTYTLTPGDVPRGYDFVDYFLFESKEGYCTYYATAMTILLRCVGIPTRYVEGFVVKAENHLGGGRFDVLGSNAHAWPEVYFEGVGFVEFEPTSSFEGPMVSPVPVNSPSPSPVPTDTPEPTEEPTPTLEPTVEPTGTKEAPTPTPDDGEVDKPIINENVVKLLKILLLVLFVIALYLAIMRVKANWVENKLNKVSSDEYIIYTYKRLEKILSRYYAKRNPSFTLPEYESLLEESKLFDIEGMRNVYDRASALFNKARYSEGNGDEKDANAMLKVYKEFIDLERNHIGKFKYFIRRYILGRL